MRLPKITGFYVGDKKKPIIGHIKKNKVKYIITGSLLASQLIIPNIAFASGIDVAGRKIHGQIVNIGKWVIIVAGSVHTIQKGLEQDNIGTRQTFFKYLLVYAILIGFPKAFDLVDEALADI